eukprot:jgi/Botrbrau1/22443/Bobra.0091s0045.1
MWAIPLLHLRSGAGQRSRLPNLQALPGQEVRPQQATLPTKMTLATSSLSSSKGRHRWECLEGACQGPGSAPDPCWVRGCSCQDGCFCSNRWVPANGEKEARGFNSPGEAGARVFAFPPSFLGTA